MLVEKTKSINIIHVSKNADHAKHIGLYYRPICFAWSAYYSQMK